MASIAAPTWNLSDLFASPDDPRLLAVLETAKGDAEAFAQSHRERVADFGADDLRVALAEYERIQQEAQKPVAWASLQFSCDTSPENGAILQRVRERHTEVTLPLLPFLLELSRLDAETLTTFAATEALAAYRHFLLVTRNEARHKLSDDAETVWEEAQNTGRRAWTRLWEETTSALRFSVPGEDALTLSETINRQFDPQRETRERAATALTDGLAPQQRTLAYIYNTLLATKATEDRLRGFAFPEAARHLENELSTEVVETVVRTAESGYPLVARYYRAKRDLLNLPELFHYDRYAPLPGELKEPIAFDAARDICLAAFAGFDAEYAETARAFFDNHWIDGATQPGKRGGAYCAYVTADTHPYIFLNYLGKTGDVRTLAHELGHGIHTSLARPQGFLSFHGTLPMAEVASTFAEQLVFDEMIRTAKSDEARLALYAEQIDQAVATVFRQTALYRFEQGAHQARQVGEVPAERFGELWQEAVGAMFAGSVTLAPGHASWWSYIPHFINTPFYVYAYTFGELLAFSLYKQCREQGAAIFAPKFKQFLSAGGSRTPQELVAPLGVDLSDAGFWGESLAVFAEQVTAFETLAARLKK
ncbi:MAG: M3 family oligoendopeptidase [Armatimonadetes bacterium]|nr:M3 family oligoendopeptidase [Armatimonadota bacterium]